MLEKSIITAMPVQAFQLAKSVLDELLDLSFLASFVNRGKMVSSLTGSESLAWIIDHGHGFQLPSEDWLKEISPSDFYEMYCTYIPTADQHM